MFRTRNKKRLPGRVHVLFSVFYSLAWLLWLLPAVMSLASPFLGARDVNAVKTSWDLGRSMVTRHWNGGFTRK